MRLAVTGASGFIGRTLAARLREVGLASSTLLIDRVPFNMPDFECRQAELTSDSASLSLFDDIDVVCHLADLPGAASQDKPAISRRVNLDLPLALIEKLAGRRIVNASSIAVYGSAFGEVVRDDTPAQPDSVYGTHKRMVELALSDAIRRGTIGGLSLRVPGVMARPLCAGGFGSAFLSDLFHAVWAGEKLTLPVSPDATTWIVSASTIASQLAHAMLESFDMTDPLLLPATHAKIADLVAVIGAHGDASHIQYQADPAIQTRFGCYPPLLTERAHNFGFATAECLDALVDAVSRTRQIPTSAANAA